MTDPKAPRVSAERTSLDEYELRQRAAFLRANGVGDIREVGGRDTSELCEVAANTLRDCRAALEAARQTIDGYLDVGLDTAATVSDLKQRLEAAERERDDLSMQCHDSWQAGYAASRDERDAAIRERDEAEAALLRLYDGIPENTPIGQFNNSDDAIVERARARTGGEGRREAMNLLLATILSFSFTFPDSNNAGTCGRPLNVAAQDSVTAIWRAQPLFATGGYMRTQVDSLRGGRGVHAQVFLNAGIDSTTLWLITVTTARMGSEAGQPRYVRSPCPRSIAKLPGH